MNIKEALQAKKPEIAAMAARIVESQFNRLVEQFGVTMKGVANSDSYRLWSETIRALCTSTKVETDHSGRSNPYALNPAAVAAYAEQYAVEVVESWETKIAEKMGELEGATVFNVSACNFHICGLRFGKAVRIEQDMIVNVSSKGKLFNQFPARIYVEGKFTSAAKYKKLAA